MRIEILTQQHLRKEFQRVRHVETGGYRLTAMKKSLIIVVKASQLQRN